jgi:hypothetical protein
VDNVYLWNFADVRGKTRDPDELGGRFFFDGDRYCLGGDETTCIFPDHDTEGNVDFRVGASGIAAVSGRLAGLQNYDFSVIVTGDNDDFNCFHNGLDLNVTVDYVIKSQ